MDYLKALRQFHKLAFNKTRFWPADINQAFIPGNVTAKLRNDLIQEEVDELKNVLLDYDEDTSKEHLLKELVDVLYVIFGTVVCYGLPIEEAFKRVHENNMLKLETAELNEFKKFKKPLNHPKVVLKDLTD